MPEITTGLATRWDLIVSMCQKVPPHSSPERATGGKTVMEGNYTGTSKSFLRWFIPLSVM